MNDFFRRSNVTKAWVDTRPHVYEAISAWFAERAKLARAEKARLARKAAR